MTPSFGCTRRLFALSCTAVVLASCKSGEDPQVPTALVPVVTASISGIVAQSVPVAPSVTLKDQKGRGINNVMVHWIVTSGGGKVTSDSSRTDATGLASSGGWTLGTTSGNQTMQATAASLAPTVFTALAAAGPLSVFLKIAGDNQQGVVNQAVLSPPSIRAQDQFGNPVPGVAVTFSTSSGVIAGTQKTTGADGVASADSWKLGTKAGLQIARAATATQNPLVEFNVIAAPGAASSITALSTEAPSGSATVQMTGTPNLVTCQQPSVKIVDSFGNPAAGGAVTFTPGPNSGTVGRATSTANAAGIASVLSWTLGAAAQQTLVATSAALPGASITFVATTSTPASAFNLCARFLGEGGTPRQREAVTKAVARWRRVIVGHVSTVHLTTPAEECTSGIPAIDEDVSDLLIYVVITNIDGPGNILGQASPCYVSSASRLSLMGFFELDQADLDLLLAEGTLDDVVLHEMGHIIGFGTLWSFGRSLLVGRGGTDPFFAGAAALQQFALIGGGTYSGNPVPVENSGGPGTRDSHWRRTVFRNELMNGFASPGGMPLSRVTVGQFADLGYQVSLADADNFTIMSSIVSGTPTAARALGNDVADVNIWSVDRSGRRELVRPRANPFR